MVHPDGQGLDGIPGQSIGHCTGIILLKPSVLVAKFLLANLVHVLGKHEHVTGKKVVILVESNVRIDGADIVRPNRGILRGACTRHHRLARSSNHQRHIHVRLVVEMGPTGLLIGASSFFAHLVFKIAPGVGTGLRTAGQSEVDRARNLTPLRTTSARQLDGFLLFLRSSERMCHLKLNCKRFLLERKGNQHIDTGCVHCLSLTHPMSSRGIRFHVKNLLSGFIRVKDQFHVFNHRRQKGATVCVTKINRDPAALLHNCFKMEIPVHHQHSPMVRIVIRVRFIRAAR